MDCTQGVRLSECFNAVLKRDVVCDVLMCFLPVTDLSISWIGRWEGKDGCLTAGTSTSQNDGEKTTRAGRAKARFLAGASFINQFSRALRTNRSNQINASSGKCTSRFS